MSEWRRLKAIRDKELEELPDEDIQFAHTFLKEIEVEQERRRIRRAHWRDVEHHINLALEKGALRSDEIHVIVDDVENQINNRLRQELLNSQPHQYELMEDGG